MINLCELLKVGCDAYKKLSALTDIEVSEKSQSLKNLTVKVSNNKVKSQIVEYSNYNRPIDHQAERLSGSGRGWGQANIETQSQIINLILENSKHLSAEDQAIILATARIESGFNPDAAATSTSASGVFQLVKNTASNLGLSQENIFDASSNIKAGIQLYEQNLEIISKRFPKLSGNQRATMIYALHHDGPSLNYGGEKIARQQIIPILDEFRALTFSRAFNEKY